MHPEFGQTTIRWRERELDTAARSAHARKHRDPEEDDARALGLIWASRDALHWPLALAAWRIGG
jgi:hypothetical protein